MSGAPEPPKSADLPVGAGVPYFTGSIELCTDQVRVLGGADEDLIREVEPRCQEFIALAKAYYELKAREEISAESPQFEAIEQTVRIAFGIDYLKRKNANEIETLEDVPKLVPYLFASLLTKEHIERAVEILVTEETPLRKIAQALKGCAPDEQVAALLSFLNEITCAPTEYPVGFVYSIADDVLLPICATFTDCELGLCGNCEKCSQPIITEVTFREQPEMIAKKVLESAELLHEVNIVKSMGILGRILVTIEGLQVSARWDPLCAQNVDAMDEKTLNWVLYNHENLVVTVGTQSLLLEMD